MKKLFLFATIFLLFTQIYADDAADEFKCKEFCEGEEECTFCHKPTSTDPRFKCGVYFRPVSGYFGDWIACRPFGDIEDLLLMYGAKLDDQNNYDDDMLVHTLIVGGGGWQSSTNTGYTDHFQKFCGKFMKNYEKDGLKCISSFVRWFDGHSHPVDLVNNISDLQNKIKVEHNNNVLTPKLILFGKSLTGCKMHHAITGFEEPDGSGDHWGTSLNGKGIDVDLFVGIDASCHTDPHWDRCGTDIDDGDEYLRLTNNVEDYMMFYQNLDTNDAWYSTDQTGYCAYKENSFGSLMSFDNESHINVNTESYDGYTSSKIEYYSQEIAECKNADPYVAENCPLCNDAVHANIDTCFPLLRQVIQKMLKTAGIPDKDEDFVIDSKDNCPDVVNGSLGKINEGIEYPNQLDSDGDGVGDACDNCINTKNPKQDNWNEKNEIENGLPIKGDACEDYDGDTVFDREDNCNETQNPLQDNWNANTEDEDEVKGDACEDYDGDGLFDREDNCIRIRNVYEGSSQPDWNSDGVGDRCDKDGDGIDDTEKRADGKYLDEQVYFSWGNWGKTYAGNEGERFSSSNGDVDFTSWTYEAGETINLSGYINMRKNEGTASTYLAKYYCDCGDSTTSHFKCSLMGTCGNNFANPRTGKNSSGIPRGIDIYGKRVWKPVKTNGHTNNIYYESKPGVDKQSKYGNGINYHAFNEVWQYQDEDQLNMKPPLPTYGNSEKCKTRTCYDSYASFKAAGNYRMTKVSYAPVKILNDRGILNIDGYLLGDNYINPNYFANYKQELQYDKINLAYKVVNEDDSKTTNIDHIVQREYSFLIRHFNRYLSSAYWQMIMEHIPGRPPWETGPGMPTGHTSLELSVSNPEDAFLRPNRLLSLDFSDGTMSMTKTLAPKGYQQFFRVNNRDTAYVKQDGVYTLMEENDGGGFKTVTEISNGIDLKSAAVLNHNQTLYMAGNLVSRDVSRSISEPASASDPFNFLTNYIYQTPFVKLEGNTLVHLAPLPSSGRFIRLITLNNSIYYISEDAQGNIKIYSYSENTDVGFWTEKMTGTLPLFSLSNIVVRENIAYFPVAGDPGTKTTKILSYTGGDTTTITEYATINKEYNPLLKLFVTDAGLTAIETTKSSGENLIAYKITQGAATEIAMEVTLAGVVENSMTSSEHCLYKEGNSIKAGIQQAGKCHEYTDLNVASINVSSNVEDVAGYGNKLFAATNQGIHVYDISDPLTPQFLYTLTDTGSTKDLEIYGDKMYTASANGVYIIDYKADPIEIKEFIYSNKDTRIVKVYNNKLYVGEIYEIKKFGLETNLIEESTDTWDELVDMAVADDKIYVYAFGWDDSINVYDADTLSNEAWDYTSCYDIELTTYKNIFYLGCDNGISEMNDSNGYINQSYFSGEIKILQDVYVNSNYSFTPEGEQISVDAYIAANAAVCGDGKVTGSEVCEKGDSVECISLSSDYSDGTATCETTCREYDISTCIVDDGW